VGQQVPALASIPEELKGQMIRIEPVRPMEDECSKGVLRDEAMQLVDARFFEVLR
jgi:hypothetical protein